MRKRIKLLAGMSNAAQEGQTPMSVVLQFPGMTVAGRAWQRNRSPHTLGAVHAVRGGSSLISWVRPASCECCGRPTLAARSGIDRETLCRHCSPLNIA